MEGVYLCSMLACLLYEGVAEPIKTEMSVLAAEGEDAPLSCQLLETKEVQQVTWQKVLEKTERNICSYIKFLGETVDPDFKEKVQFTEAGLQKSSIVIRSVTEQDGGCYLCLFNIYPDGALKAGTCLMVYELHEPILDVRRSNSPAESVVSCSATGRPAPSVTLTVLHQNISFSQSTSTSVTNSNSTVTITTTALLSAFSSTKVVCSVSVLSAAPRELLVTVPGLTETSEDDKQSASSDRGCRWPLIISFIMMMMMMMAVIFIFLLRKGLQRRNNKHSQDATENQKPQLTGVRQQRSQTTNKPLKDRDKTVKYGSSS